jgi:hypothetical protein
LGYKCTIINESKDVTTQERKIYNRKIDVIMFLSIYNYKYEWDVGILRSLWYNVKEESYHWQYCSILSWCSVLFVEKTDEPEKTSDIPFVTDQLYHKCLQWVHFSVVGIKLSGDEY